MTQTSTSYAPFTIVTARLGVYAGRVEAKTIRAAKAEFAALDREGRADSAVIYDHTGAEVAFLGRGR